MENALNVHLAFEATGTTRTARNVDRVGKSTDRARKSTDRWERALKRLKLALAAIGGAIVLRSLARSFLEAARITEGYQKRLKVLLGSVEEGNALFQLMSQYASEVPFEFEKIMDSATRMSAIVDGGARGVAGWIPLIGDLAAATGLAIDETAEQVSRMLSAGAASADKFRERGVLAMLGFQAGVSYSAEQTREKLIEAWESSESSFRGAAVEMADTWDGLMSMLSDAWFRFRQAVMDQGLFEELKKVAQQLVDLASDPAAQQFAVDTGKAFARVVSAGVDLIRSYNEIRAAGYLLAADGVEAVSNYSALFRLHFAEIVASYADGLRLMVAITASLPQSVKTLLGISGASIDTAVGFTNRVDKMVADWKRLAVETVANGQSVANGWRNTASQIIEDASKARTAVVGSGENDPKSFLGGLKLLGDKGSKAADKLADFMAKLGRETAQLEAQARASRDGAQALQSLVDEQERHGKALEAGVALGSDAARVIEEMVRRQQEAKRVLDESTRSWELQADAIDRSVELWQAIRRAEAEVNDARNGSQAETRQIAIEEEALGEIRRAGVSITSTYAQMIWAQVAATHAARNAATDEIKAINERKEAIKQAAEEAKRLREKETDDAAKEAERLADQLQQPWENALRNVQSMAASTMAETMEDWLGLGDDAASQFVKIWISAFAEVAAAAAAQQITLSVSGQGGDGGKGGGGVGGWGALIKGAKGLLGGSGVASAALWTGIYAAAFYAIAKNATNKDFRAGATIAVDSSSGRSVVDQMTGQLNQWSEAGLAIAEEFARILNDTVDGLGGSIKTLEQIDIGRKGQGSSARFFVKIEDVYREFGNDLNAAMQFAVMGALKGGTFSGLSPEVQHVLENSTAKTVEAFQAELATAVELSRAGMSEVTLAVRDMFSGLDRTLREAAEAGLEGVKFIDKTYASLDDRIRALTGNTLSEEERKAKELADIKEELLRRLNDLQEEQTRLMAETAQAQAQTGEAAIEAIRVQGGLQGALLGTVEAGNTAVEALANIEAARRRMAEVEAEIAAVESSLDLTNQAPRRQGNGQRRNDLDRVRAMLEEAQLARTSELNQAIAEINSKWDEAARLSRNNAELLAAVNEERERELALLRELAVTDFYEGLREFEQSGLTSLEDAINGVQGTADGLRDGLTELGDEMGWAASRIEAGMNRITAAEERRLKAISQQGFLDLAAGLASLVQDEKIKQELERQMEIVTFNLKIAQYKRERDVLIALGYLTEEQIAVINAAIGWIEENGNPVNNPPVVPNNVIQGNFGGGSFQNPIETAREEARRLLEGFLASNQTSGLSSGAQRLLEIREGFEQIFSVLGRNTETLRAHRQTMAAFWREQLQGLLDIQEQIAFGDPTLSGLSPRERFNEMYQQAQTLMQQALPSNRNEEQRLAAIEQLQQLIPQLLGVAPNVLGSAGFASLRAFLLQSLANITGQAIGLAGTGGETGGRNDYGNTVIAGDRFAVGGSGSQSYAQPLIAEVRALRQDLGALAGQLDESSARRDEASSKMIRQGEERAKLARSTEDRVAVGARR